MTHDDLQFKPTEFGGWRAYVEFDNGYALSIVYGDGAWWRSMMEVYDGGV